MRWLNKYLNFLSALSVTEQVFITYTSATLLKLTFSNLFISSSLEIVAVSEKLSLQPNVVKAILFFKAV